MFLLLLPHFPQFAKVIEVASVARTVVESMRDGSVDEKTGGNQGGRSGHHHGSHNQPLVPTVPGKGKHSRDKEEDGDPDALVK